MRPMRASAQSEIRKPHWLDSAPRTGVERAVDAGDDLVDRHRTVSIRVECGAGIHSQALKGNVDPGDDLVDRHCAIVFAIAHALACAERYAGREATVERERTAGGGTGIRLTNRTAEHEWAPRGGSHAAGIDSVPIEVERPAALRVCCAQMQERDCRNGGPETARDRAPHIFRRRCLHDIISPSAFALGNDLAVMPAFSIRLSASFSMAPIGAGHGKH